MFELCKLIWDFIVLRDAARKGQLKVREFLYGIGFAILLYATGPPAALLYQAHPQYKPLFIAVMIFDALLVVGFFVWAWRSKWGKKTDT